MVWRNCAPYDIEPEVLEYLSISGFFYSAQG